MQHAISKIQQLIQYHDNWRKRYLEDFDKIDYTPENKALVIENTNKIYDNLIGELNTAIDLIRKYEEANK